MTEDEIKARDLMIERSTMFGDCYPRSYSGRFMFGRECFAIDGDSTDLHDLMMEVQAEMSEEGSGLRIPAPKSDSMGMGVVYYWPQWEPGEIPDRCENDHCRAHATVCDDCAMCEHCCDCTGENEEVA